MGADVRTKEMKGGGRRESLADTGEDMTPTGEYCSAAGTYCLHAHDGLLHLGDICDMVLIGLELLLLYPFIDAYHQLPGDVSAIIYTWSGRRGASRWRREVSETWSQRGEAPSQTNAPKEWPSFCPVPFPKPSMVGSS